MPHVQGRVEVLGIRHHGPGSARSVVAALGELDPDLVLIEGAPELDALVDLAADPDLVPPVAGLVYAVDAPRRALFYPMADFSPEWAALRWALAHLVEVRFADLPAAHVLAERDAEPDPEPDPDAEPHAEPHAEPEPSAPRAGVAVRRPDAIGLLARAAGYDDPERWWEDAVEHRHGDDSALARFAMVREAMGEVRAGSGVDDGEHDVENATREAAMRRAIRVALKAGKQRIAFVCGAYHAPAIHPDAFGPAGHDSKRLAGLPRTKVAATWAPWTSRRLATASGYGAGVTAPGWYQHLYRLGPDAAADEVESTWLTRVARELRAERLDAAPASVVEAVRLAGALAAVRGRPSVGLTELDDAAQAVLCEGSLLPLQLIRSRLVIGEELGRVPEHTPMVPLAADLARQQRSVRLTASTTPTTLELDLRRGNGRARSVLLHRLTLLDLPWGHQVDAGATTGTFKEAWRLEWQPEFAVALIEAGVHGTTLVSATTSRVSEDARAASDLATLGSLVERCLVADLPDALAEVLAALSVRSAQQHDVRSLLETVEPLARTQRYGDVRGVDTAAVADILGAVVVRAGVGLRAGCASLDDTAAALMRTAVEAAHRGVTLLGGDLLDPWLGALAAVAADEVVHGAVSGRANRLLLDAGRLSTDEAARRLSRRLSVGGTPTAAAAWLDGFLEGEALLLLHDDDLLGLVDAWVAGIDESTFEDLLPLLRRTFSRFEPPERRQLGSHLRRGGRPAAEGDEPTVDLARGWPAMLAVADLLGLRDGPAAS